VRERVGVQTPPAAAPRPVREGEAAAAAASRPRPVASR
jgi:hypothetical protein